MEKLAVIVNTHPGRNRAIQYTEQVLNSLGHKTIILQGHDYIDPLDHDPTHVFLSAVPTNAQYSLTEKRAKDFVSQRYGWLKNLEIPVMGICYGHQIIAHMYGGEVKEMKNEKIALQRKIRVNSEQDNLGIFDGIETIEGFVAHNDYVRPPAGFSTIATRKRICYAMKHSEKDIYGLQFHPELSGEVGKELVKRFMELPTTNTTE